VLAVSLNTKLLWTLRFIFFPIKFSFIHLRQYVANCSLSKFLDGEPFVLCTCQLARNYTNLFAQTVVHWNKFLSVYSHTYVNPIEKRGKEMKWTMKRGKCLAKNDRALVIVAAFITRQAAMQGRSLASCGRYRESIFTLSSTQQLEGIRDLTQHAGSCLAFSFCSHGRSGLFLWLIYNHKNLKCKYKLNLSPKQPTFEDKNNAQTLWDFKFSRRRVWWWWRQYVPLKRGSTIILHGSISQKTILNFKQRNKL